MSHHDMSDLLADRVDLAIAQLDTECERRGRNPLLFSDADVYRAASQWSDDLFTTRIIAGRMFALLEDPF